MFPGDDENTCFVRSNNSDYNMYILFELCVTVSIKDKKEEEDNEKSSLVNISFKKSSNVAGIIN